MNIEQLYDNLIQLAEKLEIEVRHEDLDCSEPEITVKSGFCKIRGKEIMLIDPRSNIRERIKLLSKCLAQRNLENVFVLPAVREAIRENTDATTKS